MKSGSPLDDTGAQLVFRFVSAAYERRLLGIASYWPFDPAETARSAKAMYATRSSKPRVAI